MPQKHKTRKEVAADRKAAKANRVDRSNIKVTDSFDPKILTNDSESQRMWRWAFIGTSTAVAILENYASLGLPNGSVEHINTLIARLDAVVKNINANQAPQE